MEGIYGYIRVYTVHVYTVYIYIYTLYRSPNKISNITREGLESKKEADEMRVVIFPLSFFRRVNFVGASLSVCQARQSSQMRSMMALTAKTGKGMGNRMKIEMLLVSLCA